MSQRLIDRVRAKFPQYADVPDDRLTLAIGEKYPQYLEQDGNFARTFDAYRQMRLNDADTAARTSLAGHVGAAVESGMENFVGAAQAVDRELIAPLTGGTVDQWVSAVPEAVSMTVRDPVGTAGRSISSLGRLVGNEVDTLTRMTSLDPAGPVARGLRDAGETLPVLAASMGLQRLGVNPALAFGAPPAVQTYGETGDVAATLKAGATGALIPAVAQVGKLGGAALNRALIERNLLSPAANATQKAVEVLGSQGAVQVFMEGLRLPEYAALDPEARREAIYRNLVANTAFLAMDLPTFKRSVPSETLLRMAPAERVAYGLRDAANNPELVDALQRTADELARQATLPDAAQVEGEGPLFRREAPLGEVPGPRQNTQAPPDSASTVAQRFPGPAADAPGRPLDPFPTDQGAGETVEAGGETAIDQMLRDRRQNKFREKAEAIRARRDAWINQTLEQAGERGSLEYVSTTRPDRTVIVSPVPGQPGRWRTTQFDSAGPMGHYEFDSREQAIRAVGGEHHTKQIAGPGYFGTGEYVLKRSRERYNIAADSRPLDPFPTDQGAGETVAPDAEWNVVGMGRKAAQQEATKGTTAATKEAALTGEAGMTFPQWMNQGRIQTELSNTPDVAQPTFTKTVSFTTETLNGPKKITAKEVLLPGYRGARLLVQEYKAPKGRPQERGYRVYFRDSGALIEDSNGVSSLNDTLKQAVNRIGSTMRARGMDSSYQLVHSQIVERAKREARQPAQAKEQKTTNGTEAVAQRMVNAEEGFLEFAMQTAGLTREQAMTALAEYRKAKAIKIDPVGGQFSFTHGGFAEAEVLRRAAGIGAESVPEQSPEARLAKIKALPPAKRNPADVEWANNYTRQKAADDAAAVAEESKLTRSQSPVSRFTVGMNRLNAAKAAAAMELSVENRGRLIKRRELVEEMINGGGRIVLSPKGKRRLVRGDGGYIEESQLTKTGMDYAEFLIRERNAPVANPPEIPEGSLTKPADVRPAEPGEQPAPPAEAAPAMQGGMDNLRFISEPVERRRAGKGRPLVPDAKDAKAKLIAELEKAVAAARFENEAQVRRMRQVLSEPPEEKFKTVTDKNMGAGWQDRYRAEYEEAKRAFGGPGRDIPNVTIEIPGDGTFTVVNTKENLRALLAKAKRLETGSSMPSKAPVARAPKMDVERVIEDARKVYGDRRAIDILRRQAADESLAIEARDRALLEEASVRLANSLPEIRLKSELDRLDQQIEAMSGRRTEFSAPEFDRRLRQFKLERKDLARKLDEALTEAGGAVAAADSGGKSVAGSPRQPQGTFGLPAIPAGTATAVPSKRMVVTMERLVPGFTTVANIEGRLSAIVDVARGIADASPIRSNRLSRRFAGVYTTPSRVVRMWDRLNLPTTAHEVAHALADAIFGTAASRGLRGIPPAVGRELVRLGRNLYGNTRPNAGYAAEGWAELVADYLTTDDIARRAPEATAWLENTVLPAFPEVAQAMREARAEIDVWRGMGAHERMRAQTAPHDSKLARLRTELGRYVGREGLVEQFAPFEALSRRFRQVAGRDLAADEDPFLIASARRGQAGSILAYMADEGMIDPSGNRTGGRSLREALAPVTRGLRPDQVLARNQRAADFWSYLWARRAIERWGLDRNPGISLADAQYLRQTLETPDFQLAASRYYQWWDGVLDYLAASSPANRELVARIRAGSKDYVPLARMLDPNQTRPGEEARLSNALRRMRGSSLPVRMLDVQTLLTAESLIARAHRDQVLEAVFRLANQPGMGAMIEEVPRSQVQEVVNIERLRAQLEGMGVDTTGIPADTLLEYYTGADAPGGSDPIVARRVNGEVRWYYVRPDLYAALEGIQPARLPLVADLLLGVPARLFRLGTTGLRPAFSLFTNPVRDIQTFLMQSTAGMNPLRRVAQYFGALGDIVRSGMPGADATPYRDLFDRLGIMSGQPLGGDIGYARREARGLFHGRVFKRVTAPVETLRELLSFSEATPRIAELRLRAQEMGWAPGQPLTPAQAIQLTLAAKRVTTDFSAGGSYARLWSQAVPFLNASIQGTRGFLRAMRERPLQATLYGVSMFTLPALWTWWHNKDEEWYQALPWRERYLYWNVPDENGQVYQIPRPPEWNNAFAVIPEALMDAAYRDNPDAVKAAFGHLFATTNPFDLPVLARIAWEQARNRVDFFDRPIVPRAQVDLRPGEQVGPYTSWLATSLGKAFPETISPRRVDHLLRGVGGGTASDTLSAIEQMAGLKAGALRSEPSETPVVGRALRRGGQFSAVNRQLADLYDLHYYWQARARNKELAPELAAYARYVDDQIQMVKFGQRVAEQTEDLKARQSLYRDLTRQAESMLADAKRLKRLPAQQ